MEKALDFVRRFHQETGQVPSVRRICRAADLSPPRFYRLFGSLESLVERSGLKLDRETMARIKSTRKATRKRVKKSKRKYTQKEQPPPAVESGDVEQPHVRAFEEIRENVQDEEEAKDMITEKAQCFAEELKTLALTGHPHVNGPILEALAEVLPLILWYNYDVEATIPDLLVANHTLKQVKKQRKKLRKQQTQLDGERLELESARELLNRDSSKKSLLEHIEKLEWQGKVNIKRFNETYEVLKRFRTLFRELMKVIRKFPDCHKTFVENMMESHNDVLEWLLSKKWTRLSFEAEGMSRLPSQT